MTANKTIVPTSFYAVFIYFLMLPVALLVAAVVWAYNVSGVLYICAESAGILDFIPPFVHSGEGDVYKVAAWQVYLAWFALLAAAILLPALIAWSLWRLSGRDEQHEG